MTTAMSAIRLQMNPPRKPNTVLSSGFNGLNMGFGANPRPATRSTNSNNIGCAVMGALAVVGTFCALVGWGMRYFR